MAASAFRTRRGAPLILAALALVLLLPARPVSAQESEVFAIADVHVDEVSKTAADARAVALAKGERRAFTEILKRLTLRSDHGRLPELGRESIAGYVQDFAVANEKNSSVRYLADLTFRFKASEIRNLMRDYGLRYAETQSKPVLVLPLYQEAGALALWDDPNPWREVWEAAPPLSGLVPMRVPDGGLQDIASISAELAARGDEQRLSAVARQYGLDTVIVARAGLAPGREGRQELRVDATSYGSDARAQTLVTTLYQEPGEAPEALLERGRRELIGMIEDRWKEANLIQFEQNSVMIAAMPIAGLHEWVEAQRRMRDVAVIQRIDLVLLSRDEARFNLFYLGDAAQLKLALAQEDLTLTEGQGNWTVSFSGGGGRGRDQSEVQIIGGSPR